MSRDPEALIVDCIGQYPTLFPNRTSVLHHLFIVLGGGFEWRNGELVDACRNLTRGFQIPRADAERRAKTHGPLGHVYPHSPLSNLNTMPGDVLPAWRALAEETRSTIYGAAPPTTE